VSDSRVFLEHADMPVPAQLPQYVVRFESRFDFDTTLIRVTQQLTSRGMVIFADIDQARFAAKVGDHLRPTRLILFGNPKAGTPIMAANPHAALELPLKVLVWQDDRGAVNVDYLNPAALLTERYGIEAALTGAFAALPDLFRQAAVGQ